MKAVVAVVLTTLSCLFANSAHARDASVHKYLTPEEFLKSGEQYAIFIGNYQQMAQFRHDLQSAGLMPAADVMVGEIHLNGIDDNNDKLVDNAFGWDAVKNQPIFPFNDSGAKGKYLERPLGKVAQVNIYSVIAEAVNGELKNMPHEILSKVIAKKYEGGVSPIVIADKEAFQSFSEKMEKHPPLDYRGREIVLKIVGPWD